jgi:photosystem II stability/assembly factor-like uncharacterized protein
MMFTVKRNILRCSLFLLAVSLLSTALLASGPWQVLGPDGGDARSLAFDPHTPDRLLLGTAGGEIFSTNDRGETWSRLARLGGDDYVLDHIIVDPVDSNRIYVSAWSGSSQQRGDVFRTLDGGTTWQTLPTMHGKSIRAMAMYKGDTRILVAGALDGVYRTSDGGDSWQLLSPANSTEIKNIESIAIDPKHPDTVYAGTWHLAWKTSDAGANWQHINKGMIDDSDVFSVIVDHENPSIVFASACSGIYKSETAGNQFAKIQGIPFSARRTRVLKQDPTNENIVYAGTTEGLWKTSDLGKTWKHVSSSDVVVNDVLVDPRDSTRVLLATDRSGVMVSTDGALKWTASNKGYAHRYVSTVLADNKDVRTLFVGVVNDREYGGVFYSSDAGQHWLQKATGLGGKDVFALKQAPDGMLMAGTNRGVYTLAPNGKEWHPMNVVAVEHTVTTAAKGFRKPISKTTYTKSQLESRVNDLDIKILDAHDVEALDSKTADSKTADPKTAEAKTVDLKRADLKHADRKHVEVKHDSETWLAATTSGIYSSTDQGKIWKGGPILGQTDFVSVRANGATIVAATRSNVLVSNDNGSTWQQATLPPYVASIRGVAIASDTEIMVAAREGAFRSGDGGSTWEHIYSGLPDKDISSVTFDVTHRRLLATSDTAGVIFESTDGGRTWQRGPDSGYPLRRIALFGGRFVGATPFDGVILQPEHESTGAAAGGTQ